MIPKEKISALIEVIHDDFIVITSAIVKYNRDKGKIVFDYSFENGELVCVLSHYINDKRVKNKTVKQLQKYVNDILQIVNEKIKTYYN